MTKYVKTMLMSVKIEMKIVLGSGLIEGYTVSKNMSAALNTLWEVEVKVIDLLERGNFKVAKHSGKQMHITNCF